MRRIEKPPFISTEYNYADILMELVQLRKYEDFFAIDDHQYPYWEKWKYIAKEWEFDPKKIWAAVKSNRQGGRRIHFSKVESFTFNFNAPGAVQQYLHEFDMNLGGSLQSDRIIPTEEKDHYLISSLMEEAIASSQIEGAATTRKVAKEMLESNRKPVNASEQMIVNNYEGMKWIVENKHVPFTPERIRHLHTIITRDTLHRKDEEGSFRQDDGIKVVDAQTGYTIYTPPPHEQLTTLIDTFCEFANDAGEQSFFVHPIAKGIILHFLIGYIHPFTDGNGRTARTIFYWYLLKKGYWLIEYMSVSRIILGSKAQYARAYQHTELDDNDLTYFILYNLKCIHSALEQLKQYITKKTAEKKNTMQLLRNTTLNDRQISIIQELIQDTNSYISVQQIQNRFGVSNQTARNDLNNLVETGLLEYRKSSKKIQFFPVKDFVNKVNKNK